MAYRPEHPVIIVVNADGSGYVKQFDTLAEAKELYKTIVTDGVAYLYPQAKKSLAEGSGYAPIPEYNNGVTYSTGALVSINGTVYKLINFIGAGGYGPITHPYAWTTDVVLPPAPPPISSTGSPQVVNGVERKGMTFNSSQNTGADPVIREEVSCEITTIEDIDGMPHRGPYLKVSTKIHLSGKPPTVEDTTFTSNGDSPCFYPNGYRITWQSRNEDSKIETKTIYSLDYSGMMYGPYYNPSYILRLARTYTVADGNGGTRQELENGVARFENPSPNKYTTTWVQYFNGDTPYAFNINDLSITDPIGNPIPNGRYLVTYKVNGDERIHSGAWVGRIDDPVAATVVWKFEPESPEQPPPPPCSITRKRLDDNGVVLEECDPTIVYPFSVTDNCEPDATVSIDESLIVVGSNTKNGMNNGYGDITWGECSGMVYKPYGTAIYDNADYNFFSDGLGSYYSEEKYHPPTCEDSELHTGEAGWTYDGCYWNYVNPCPPAETTIEQDATSPFYILINESQYRAGTRIFNIVANGDCSTSEDSVRFEYYTNGTQIGNDFDYNYFSDGSGGYYSEGRPACEDSTLHTSGVDGWTYDGCNWSYSGPQPEDPLLHEGEAGWTYDGFYWSYTPPCPPYGDASHTDECNNYYHDGNCGYYSEPNGNCGGGCEDSGLHQNGVDGWNYDGCHWSYSEPPPPCNAYGIFEYQDGDYYHYADGNCGTYSEYHPPACEPYGNQIDSGSGNYTVNVGCGDFIVGSYSYASYADGNCGSYGSGEGNYYPYGQFIGNCNDYNYYSDNNGGSYQGEYTGTPCDSYGYYLGMNSDVYFADFGCGVIPIGDWNETIYADGNCGSYANRNSNYYYPYGAFVANCEGINYFSDGNGGFFNW